MNLEGLSVEDLADLRDKVIATLSDLVSADQEELQGKIRSAMRHRTLGNRNYFLNKTYGIGGGNRENAPWPFAPGDISAS